MDLPKIHFDLAQLKDPTVKHADEDLLPIPTEFLKVLDLEKPEHILMVGFKDLPPSVNALYRATNKSGRPIVYLTHKGKQWKTAMRKAFMDEVLAQGWAVPPERVFIKMNILYGTDGWVFPDPNNTLKLLIDAAEKSVFVNDKYVLTHIIGVKIRDPRQTLIMFTY